MGGVTRDTLMAQSATVAATAVAAKRQLSQGIGAKDKRGKSIDNFSVSEDVSLHWVNVISSSG